ncbi:MAG: AMP-binding protein, partial [Flavobacteriales bacterium]
IWPLMHFGTIYHVGNSTSKYTEAYRLMEEFQIRFAILVPSVLNMLRPYFEEIHLPHLKVIGLCGEAALTDIIVEARNCWPQARFFNFYGPTECTIYCTAYEIPKDACLEENGIVSIGTPLKNVQYRIADAQCNAVDKNEKGLLWIGGSQVMPGYLGSEELTQSVIRQIDGVRYYNTGDIVVEGEYGHLFYLGRADQQVKINGYRVELSEIEYHAKTALDSSCAVIASRDQRGIDKLILFMLKDSARTEDSVRSFLAEKIPSYMVPERVILLPEFPLNSNGKLDRKALKMHYEQHGH